MTTTAAPNPVPGAGMAVLTAAAIKKVLHEREEKQIQSELYKLLKEQKQLMVKMAKTDPGSPQRRKYKKKADQLQSKISTLRATLYYMLSDRELEKKRKGVVASIKKTRAEIKKLGTKKGKGKRSSKLTLLTHKLRNLSRTLNEIEAAIEAKKKLGPFEKLRAALKNPEEAAASEPVAVDEDAAAVPKGFEPSLFSLEAVPSEVRAALDAAFPPEEDEDDADFEIGDEDDEDGGSVLSFLTKPVGLVIVGMTVFLTAKALKK